MLQSKTSLMHLKTSTAKGTGQNPAENIEFQVLFNDFTTNDFNTLFQSLPAGRRYYSAGVPGSFFERVLPKESFHIGVINYAFHFTSKIPKGITDRDSPSWNRDMHCTGFNKAVKKAYLDQYSADAKILLDARADELVPGGLMLLFGSCLRDGVKMSETSKGIVLYAVGASLNDLAQQVCCDGCEKIEINRWINNKERHIDLTWFTPNGYVHGQKEILLME